MKNYVLHANGITYSKIDADSYAEARRYFAARFTGKYTISAYGEYGPCAADRNVRF